MKKKTKYQTNISISRGKKSKKSYFLYLKRERMRNEKEENEFMSNFLFFLNKK